MTYRTLALPFLFMVVVLQGTSDQARAQDPSARPLRSNSSTSLDHQLRQELPYFGHSYFPVDTSVDAPSGDADRLTAPPSTEKSELDDAFAVRLDKLEAEWAAHKKKIEEELSAKSAKPTAPTFEIGGRIQADYWTYPQASRGIGFFEHPTSSLPNYGVDPEDELGFRRVRLEMQGDALENMYWRLQVDFATPDSAKIKDVYIGFRNLPGNQTLQIGVQKPPLGFDALTSSRFTLFLERPYANEAFNENFRRLGILAQGNSDDDRYLWQYGVYELEDLSSDGLYIGDAYQLTGNARLAFRPWYDKANGGRNYLHLAVAGELANPDGDADAADTNMNEARFRSRPEARSASRWIDTGRIVGANWFEVMGLETVYNRGPFQLVGEYQHTWLQRDTAALNPSGLQFGGWYLYANYILTGEHIPYDPSSGTIGRLKPFHNFGPVDRCFGGSGGGWGAWGVGLRYSTIDLNSADVVGGQANALTFALNWYWTAYAHLQFNVVSGEITDHQPVGGYTQGRYTIIGTRAALDF